MCFFFFFSLCRRVVSEAIVIAIVRDLRQSVNKWDVNRTLVWLSGGSCTWKPCSRFALSVFYFMNYLMAWIIIPNCRIFKTADFSNKFSSTNGNSHPSHSKSIEVTLYRLCIVSFHFVIVENLYNLLRFFNCHLKTAQTSLR